MAIRIVERFMTENDCFKDGRHITPSGIVLHSTAEPGVPADAWFDMWNVPPEKMCGREVCVHAFMDDDVVMQYLPWDMRGWHAGGSANNSCIGIEICEPAGVRYVSDFEIVDYDPVYYAGYFNAVWNGAAELCALLAGMYGFDETAIFSHFEGFKRGVASHHEDPDHWFIHHGRTMDDFRAAVKAVMPAKR